MGDESPSSVNQSLKKTLFKTSDNAAVDNGFLSGKFDTAKSSRVKIPEISLPKGGGALKGIDEKFEINSANGTATLSIPLPITPGRNGFQPALSLTYNSGSGNSVFGHGWDTSLQFIQRRTDKKLPRYNDDEESDVFIFSGLEDLQPLLLERDGSWQPVIHYSGGYEIKAYRPRVEGSFSRIERIRHPEKGTFWKVTTRENIVTFYGCDTWNRIADPRDPRKIYKWFPAFSLTDKGDWIQFIYSEENLDNVPDTVAEKNRISGHAVFTNLYLKQINYGNQVPYYRDCVDNIFDPSFSPEGAHFFQLVFDYGSEDGNKWGCRIDPFSDYHAGFEIRTYRLCRSIKMYHIFEELGDGPCLISSLDLGYQDQMNDPAAQPTEFTYLKSITQTGYVKQQGVYLSKSLPKMDFGYQELKWNTKIENITPENIANAPSGITGNYQWADLFSEGISGILTEQGDAWYYKYNQGNGNFTPPFDIIPKPSFTGLTNGDLQLTDLEGDGSRQIVCMQRGNQGYFSVLDNNEWDLFHPFETVPEVDLQDPFIRMLDLDGDGRADVLITEESIFRWYPSLGKKGYGPLEIASLELDEERSPRIIFADAEQTIFLADMSGDGLTDIVRIRNGAVCYWPNMGYARFGAKVEMYDAPWFDTPDLFNPSYIYLADVSGTGATDILYLGRENFRAWLNFSGNGWSDACVIDPFFSTALPDKISVVDLLGNGTSCIVWSSPLPYNAHAPMKYIDLMSGRKPHVMNFFTNNCGCETRLSYKSSTQFYLEDKKNGQPWMTKLPFPVQCVCKKEVWEKVSNTFLVNTFTYHHGYYDHAEREFRGFGRVDQLDTQQFEVDQSRLYNNHCEHELNEPPVLTRTWYHVGAYLQNKQLLDHFRHEYWYHNLSLTVRHGETKYLEYQLPDARFIGNLNNVELREAHRACKGMVLRQEVFALDGSEKELLPYTVSEHNCYIKMLQPVRDNRYAVFLVSESEAITFSYERNVSDPRIGHTLNLHFDELGNILKSASIVYPRKKRPAGLENDHIWKEQNKVHIVQTQNTFTNDLVSGKAYRLRLPFEVKVFELNGFPERKEERYFSIADFDATMKEISYETPFSTGILEKRCIDHVKKIYLSNDLSRGMPEGEIDSLGLIHETYNLAVSTDLLKDVFRHDSESLITNIKQVMEDGRYVDLENDGNWWARSGRMIYEDPAKAREMFYLPRAYEDPFGTKTTIKYFNEDKPKNKHYWLLINGTTDALNNSVNILRFNFRNLSPEVVKDINHNLSEVVFDELGMVTATAVHGKEDEAVGDRIDATVRPFLPIKEIKAFFEDPFSAGADAYEKGRLILGNATSRQIYDFSQIPVTVASIVRETHVSEEEHGALSKLQYSFQYSGGLGNVILKKSQAPPGPAWGKDDQEVYKWLEGLKYRWIGSGRTVLNNKGKPVKQYEPYFSQRHLCETEDLILKHGVSPAIHYDPLGRTIRTDLPDGTFTENIFDNWRQEIWDANDTVLRSRWYENRINGSYQKEGKDARLERDAAEKASIHAATFTTIHLDCLGRAVATDSINKWQRTRLLAPGKAHYSTIIGLDLKGNVVNIADARQNLVVRYIYDIQGQILYQRNMETGERWSLNDVMANPVHMWDNRSQQFYTKYDLLRRPTEVNANTRYYSPPEPGENINERKKKWITVSKTFFGGNDERSIAANLNGLSVTSYDTAGVQKILLADFKGNIIRSTRQFCKFYKTTPDWSQAYADHPLQTMEKEIYVTQTIYDALNRPVELHTPCEEPQKANIIYSYYNETNQLNRLRSYVGNSGSQIDSIKQIDYNARGQRSKIIYGNNTTTRYHYDPETFRLLKLQTQVKEPKENEYLQLLTHTYDPSGNITYIKDDAFRPAYFKNHVVNPDYEYTYDAIYRLIQASGREFWANGEQVTRYEKKRPLLESCSSQNSNEVRQYTQCYEYDSVGNVTKIQHAPALGPGWVRNFSYNDDNNRLTNTKTNSNGSLQHYNYDPHGNMLNLNAAHNMYWDYMDRFSFANLAVASGDAAEQSVWYVYDQNGQRTRKIIKKQNKIEERIYLGLVEIYREYKDEDKQTKIRETETLHIFDSTHRIAMVESVLFNGESKSPRELIRYQYSDHLGSASLELNDQAKIISYEEYYPYGNTSFRLKNKSVKAASKRYRYTGKERDQESGLYYYGARYYIPWLARWLSADTIGIKDGLNLYQYVHSNPVAFTDPGGNQANGDEMMGDWAASQQGTDELGLEWSVMWQSLWGGQTQIDPDTGRVTTSPPENGVGGFFGGIIRAASLRLIPIEDNPSPNSLSGMAVGGPLVPFVDAGARLITGEAVNGQEASRGWAALDLGLQVLPGVISRAAAIDASITGNELRAASASGNELQALNVERDALLGEKQALLESAQADSRTFFTVQDEANQSRLIAGGEPWPSGVNKSLLGEGLYSWGARPQAEAYLQFLETTYSIKGLSIVEATIGEAEYQGLRTLDLRTLGDEALDAWIESHSAYGQSLPHGYEHVIRQTGNFGPEYYFAKEIFHLFGF